MELKDQLALQLVSTDAWTDQRRRDIAASVLLMLVPSFEVLDTALKGVDEEQAYRIDGKLLSDLYASCPKHLKLALAHTPAFSRLGPRAFLPLFRDAWQIKPATLYQRRDLALTLEAFLGGNQKHGESFRDIIMSLFWSPVHELCLRGIYQVGYLGDLAPKDLDRIRQKLSGSVHIRMNALNGLTLLARRHREVAPAIREFITSDPVLRAARHIQKTDPDEGARSCARYLLKAVREYQRAAAARAGPRDGGRRR